MSGPHKHVPHDASASVTAPTSAKKPVAIWFFVGILCLMYGLVLIPVGIYQLSHPPAVVLPNLHATLWWGALLTIFGGFYTIRFRP
ncbi:MAG: hypothetical protein PW789_03915 [Edaphobacter sp.]|uniref:hypothetical protein n=1 Tax=Edaphobacter sp. TaxID=1934404 RepID=UPI0023833142|nr:hypothetical protein [Edaphobacter sp.]MDE1175732.1 hypothetical protein [Edaphobacter sp.]